MLGSLLVTILACTIILVVHVIQHIARNTTQIYLFLPQIPQLDLTIVVSSCQLVDVRQVRHAEDEVIDKPGRILTNVCDILFLLLVLHQLLAVTLASLLVLVRVARVSGLWIEFSREYHLHIPAVDNALDTTREEQLLLSSLDVGHAQHGAWHIQRLPEPRASRFQLIESNGVIGQRDSYHVAVR